MSTPDPAPQPKPQRGWRRGLLIAGIVLVVALILRDRDRTAARSRPPPTAPLPAPTALPAATSLAAPSQARPRLLVLLPDAGAPPTAGLSARLRRACAERLALVEGDERIAKALGIEALPAFVFYNAAGQERKRLSGPDAVALLLAELQAMGVPTAGLAGEAVP